MRLFGRNKEDSSQEPHQDDDMVPVSRSELRALRSLAAQHMAQDRFANAVRNDFVDRLGKATHLDDEILEALRSVRRIDFVPSTAWPLMVEGGDQILPINPDGSSTMSQPSLVAMMLQQLRVRPHDNILEIGAGSGYNAALLGRLAHKGHVTSVEFDAQVAELAQDNVRHAGIRNVTIVPGDGHEGYLPNAPYDRIMFTASLNEIPNTVIEQLRDPGLLLAPVGPVNMQHLVTGEKRDGRYTETRGDVCRFVRMRRDE